MAFSRSSLLQRLSSPGFLLPALVLLTIVVYWPGLYGYFAFDDFSNIVKRDDVHIEELSPGSFSRLLDSGISSVLGRPVAMITFGINYYFAGLDPLPYKLTNILIHCLCGIALYFFGRELTRTPLVGRENVLLRNLPWLLAGLWLLHPLNVSTTLYIVQRMTQFSALAVIIGLTCFCRFRTGAALRPREGLAAYALLLLVFAIGVLSKENAALLVPLILVSEFFLYRGTAMNPGHRFFYRLFLPTMVLLPAIGVTLLLVYKPVLIIGSYDIREFSLAERVLTQTRVIWHYIDWILLPDTKDLFLYHENFPLSHSLLQPLTTLLSIAGIAALAAAALLLRSRLPLAGYGIAFFFTAHLMESTIVNLELVFEHRNYLPALGLLLALLAILARADRFISGASIKALVAVYFLFMVHGTAYEARKWSNSITHLTENRSYNPTSYRINYSLGSYMLEIASQTDTGTRFLELSSDFYHQAAEYDNLSVMGHVGYFLATSQMNRPLDPEIIDSYLEFVSTRNERFINKNMPDIAALIECYYNGRCKFDEQLVIDTLNGIARNPNLDTATRQGILVSIADHLLREYELAGEALAVFYLARSLDPTVAVINVRLLQLEFGLGNEDNARQLLNGITEADGYENYSEEITPIRQALNGTGQQR